MKKLNESLKKTATSAADAAGKVLLKYFQNKFEVKQKEGAGLVTNADLEAEEAAIRILKKNHPEFGILAEESGIEKTDSTHRWIIDPLDGTTNFVHGFPMFCVSIAAEVDGRIQVGVVYHPILNEKIVAVRGEGVFLNQTPLQVSSASRIEDSLLTTGFTYHKDDLLPLEMKTFQKVSQKARAVRRPGSAALDLAYTARGTFDGFWERGLSPWDVAAGILMVEEAGGRVTDLQGNPFNWNSTGILATNSLLHPLLLQEVSSERQRIDA